MSALDSDLILTFDGMAWQAIGPSLALDGQTVIGAGFSREMAIAEFNYRRLMEALIHRTSTPEPAVLDDFTEQRS